MPVEWVVGGPDPDAVMRETWGHLDAEDGRRYRGSILFAEGQYRDQVLLSVDFGEAGYGPWFYEGIHDWLIQQDTEPGYIYKFDGFYRRRGERHEFVGEIFRKSLVDF